MSHHVAQQTQILTRLLIDSAHSDVLHFAKLSAERNFWEYVQENGKKLRDITHEEIAMVDSHLWDPTAERQWFSPDDVVIRSSAIIDE